MKHILVGKEVKGVAIVSDEDYESLSRYKWYIKPSKHTSYASRWDKGRNVLMHRQILGIANSPSQVQTDHINRNGLDNRRENLRVVDQSLNNVNRGMQRNNSSGHRGVYFAKHMNKWKAQIKTKGKMTHIGYFSDKQEAAKAYNAKAKELWGEYATPNEV